MTSEEPNEDRTIRTNVRLPSSLHERLKTEAAKRKTTIEDLVRAAIVREIVGEKHGGAIATSRERALLIDLVDRFATELERVRVLLSSQPRSGEALLRNIAATFLHYLPFGVLVRRFSGEIFWCNRAFEEIVGSKLQELEGKTFQELGLPSKESSEDLHSLEHDVSTRVRTLVIDGRSVGCRDMRFRFLSSFGHPSVWIADIYFLTGEIDVALRSELVMPVNPAGLDVMPPDETVEVLAALLDHLPTSAVAKDRERRILWCNRAYGKLVPPSVDPIGRRSEEIIPLPDDRVAKQDSRVVSEQRAVLGSNLIKDTIVRTVMRFPIFDTAGTLLYIGALGIDPASFELEAFRPNMVRPDLQTD